MVPGVKIPIPWAALVLGVKLAPGPSSDPGAVLHQEAALALWREAWPARVRAQIGKWTPRASQLARCAFGNVEKVPVAQKMLLPIHL